MNGSPISLLQPEILRLKTYEPMLLLGADKFANVSSLCSDLFSSCCEMFCGARAIFLLSLSPRNVRRSISESE